MVSKQTLIQKFNLLDDYMGLLKDIAKKPGEVFLKDRILIGSAKYYLQVSIECCLDVANHIIASERWRAPKDYADSFKVVCENGLIPEKLGMKLQQMAKFRNRLVHLYGEIDDSNVYQYITRDISDLVRFQEIVIKRYGK
jgi:uncharacterized protein YutE (UPF0331/DUF86 family)